MFFFLILYTKGKNMLSNIKLKSLSLRTEELEEVGLLEEECYSPEESAQQESEIQQEVLRVENDLDSAGDALESVQSMNNTIEESEEVIADPNVTEEQLQNQIEVSQEAFAFAIGKLGYNMSEFKKIKINTESASNKREKLKLHTEGIGGVVKKIIENIVKFFKKIYNFIMEIVTKVINWIKGLFIKKPPTEENKEKEEDIAKLKAELKPDFINKLKKELNEIYTSGGTVKDWLQKGESEALKILNDAALKIMQSSAETKKSANELDDAMQKLRDFRNKTNGGTPEHKPKLNPEDYYSQILKESMKASIELTSPFVPFTGSDLTAAISKYPQDIINSIRQQMSIIKQLLNNINTSIAKNEIKCGYDTHTTNKEIGKIAPEEPSYVDIATKCFSYENGYMMLSGRKKEDKNYDISYSESSYSIDGKLRKAIEDVSNKYLDSIQNSFVKDNVKEFSTKIYSNLTKTIPLLSKAIDGARNDFKEIKKISDEILKSLEKMDFENSVFKDSLSRLDHNIFILCNFASKLITHDLINYETKFIKIFSNMLTAGTKYYN